jgi:hypothetical protein
MTGYSDLKTRNKNGVETKIQTTINFRAKEMKLIFKHVPCMIMSSFEQELSLHVLSWTMHVI